MLPLVVKQIKSQEKMNEVQPLINDIQRKYKNEQGKIKPGNDENLPAV